MFIFNTTYLVSDKVHDTWLNWVREQHVPFMLDSTYFTKPQVARVVTSDKEDGTSFSVQFHVQDMQTLKKWHNEYSSLFQENCSQHFGIEVIFFTTVLEIVD
jgi:hypothetical protein